MSWFASFWAWIAEHPVTAIGVVAVLVVTVVTVAMTLRRRRVYSIGALGRVEGRQVEFNKLGTKRRAHRAAALQPEASMPAPAPLEAAIGSISSVRSRGLDPSTPQGALEIEAGQLAYQIPSPMWLGVQETVEVRLGSMMAREFMEGFISRGDIKLEHVPIVETMSVSLVCEPGAFDVESRSQEVQLVKPDLVKGTAFHQADFGKWVWLVTPRESGEHTLLVKVSAAMKDSRGLPTTAALPDKIIPVTVRVDFVRATAGAIARAVPTLAGTVVTTLVGIFTHEYWWPYVRDTVWPAVRAIAGVQ